MSEHHSTWPELSAGSELSVEHLLKVSSEKTVRIAALEEALRAITFRDAHGFVIASYNPGFDLRKVAPVLDSLHSK
jgi:hypothetical protein